MNKSILLILMVVAISSALKIHLKRTEQPESQLDYHGPHIIPEGGPKTKEQEQAFQRFAQFLESEPELSQLLGNGGEPNDQQLKKISLFMLDDEFFQQGILLELQRNPENGWLTELPREAQIRAAKIIIQSNIQSEEDEQQINETMKRLLEDKQIGPALKKKFEQQFDHHGNGRHGDSHLQQISSFALRLAASHYRMFAGIKL